jgi:hypothetical protein
MHVPENELGVWAVESYAARHVPAPEMPRCGWSERDRLGRVLTQRLGFSRYSQPPDRSSNGKIFMNASTAWIWPS